LLSKKGSPNYGPQAGFGLQRHFVNNLNIISLRRTCWYGRMQHFKIQSYCVRCLVLEWLCNSLCGPWIKNWDPWSKVKHDKSIRKQCRKVKKHMFDFVIKNHGIWYQIYVGILYKIKRFCTVVSDFHLNLCFTLNCHKYFYFHSTLIMFSV